MENVSMFVSLIEQARHRLLGRGLARRLAERARDRQNADVARCTHRSGRQLPRLLRPHRHRPRRHTTDEADQFPPPHVRPQAHDKALDRIVSAQLKRHIQPSWNAQ